ncbi:hypothetical protein BDU57DRAFT_160154 [Ampelomyces quisqualis]|uniref:Uncharacterized protein n=1 Tax=Ampelomyces quisqualis TaxID=50730 RepID=A0A6A5QR42_AMPQU|nr:hypothetical protein BDU57DRAFT_160154 [Ampelomyces quisqualis]
MSSSSLFLRSGRPLSRSRFCASCCPALSVPSICGNALAKSLARPGTCTKVSIPSFRRAYAAPARVRQSMPQGRDQIVERGRIAYYALVQKQGVLIIDRVKANSIVKEFLARQKTTDHGDNIQHLSNKYGICLEDLASLAIVTWKIPEPAVMYDRKPLSSQGHRSIATSMLKGCAQLEDPLATIHILTGVYLAGTSGPTVYREFASFFNQSEVLMCKQSLDKLGPKSKTFPLGPEALTLQGIFLEKEGKVDNAERHYLEAVERVHFKYNPRSRHPMQFPLITPWNALGYLFKSSRDPSRQAQAKEYFKRGAFEGDDPLSYYELAAFEQRTDPEWLQYTSKAAASGHRQATVDLADFYREASLKDSPIVAATSMKKALKWLLDWKSGSADKLADEWLRVASKMGHKPSTLRLADQCESNGDQEGAKEHLRRLTEPPIRTNQVEEWPQLVQLATKRLAGIKV